MGEDRTRPYTRRLTVRQAAGQLGISEGAVRNRIKRGTLRAQREAGRVYGLLSETAQSDKPPGESELVAVLREQLAAERQAHAEARRIIAGLVERIPALEAPASEATEAEATDAPQTASETSDRAEPQSATGEAQEGAQRPQERSWWRRVFGQRS